MLDEDEELSDGEGSSCVSLVKSDLALLPTLFSTRSFSTSSDILAPHYPIPTFEGPLPPPSMCFTSANHGEANPDLCFGYLSLLHQSLIDKNSSPSILDSGLHELHAEKTRDLSSRFRGCKSLILLNLCPVWFHNKLHLPLLIRIPPLSRILLVLTA